jgi:hypothetical protein
VIEKFVPIDFGESETVFERCLEVGCLIAHTICIPNIAKSV